MIFIDLKKADTLVITLGSGIAATVTWAGGEAGKIRLKIDAPRYVGVERKRTQPPAKES